MFFRIMLREDVRPDRTEFRLTVVSHPVVANTYVIEGRDPGERYFDLRASFPRKEEALAHYLELLK